MADEVARAANYRAQAEGFRTTAIKISWKQHRQEVLRWEKACDRMAEGIEMSWRESKRGCN